MTKYAYMCRTDFIWEFPEGSSMVEIYSSLEELKKQRKCIDDCGYVVVKIEEVGPNSEAMVYDC